MQNMQKNQTIGLFATESNHFFNEQSQFSKRKSIHLGNNQLRRGPQSSILLKSKNSLKLVSPDLQSLVGKIQNFVDDIDQKIQNRVQLVKQVYLNEYRSQVLEMSSQLKRLREKLDNEVMKEKANQKMFYLEQERDFFRHQVTKLNEQMNILNEDNKILRRQIEEEKRQVANYKQIVYNLESKLLKLKNFNLQRVKMLKTAGISKVQPSTIETKKGSITQRGYDKTMKSLQTIQDQSERDMSQQSGTRLKASQSMRMYPKMSPSQHQKMTSTIKYPRLTVEKLQKIEGYSQLLQRQKIIDQCINEIKKQIYYRNLSIGEKDTKIHFNIEDQIGFASFTKTDKKELIIKLISHEKILHQFYQYLFNNSTKSQESQVNNANQLINNKLDANSSNGFNPKYTLSKLKFTDAKFNTQQLNNLKTQFNKKIYDIKHNR